MQDVCRSKYYDEGKVKEKKLGQISRLVINQGDVEETGEISRLQKNKRLSERYKLKMFGNRTECELN